MSGISNSIEQANGIIAAIGGNGIYKGNGIILATLWGNSALKFNGIQISAINVIESGNGLQIGIFNKGINFKGV